MGGGEYCAGGLGISSTRDIRDYDTLVAEARRTGRKIAVHAGERDSGDIDNAIALDPDLLIHCTHATKKQLRECADMQIPIAVCPRSNWILGVGSSARHPPLADALITRIKELHSYDIPANVAWPIERLSADFGDWVEENGG